MRRQVQGKHILTERKISLLIVIALDETVRENKANFASIIISNIYIAGNMKMMVGRGGH